MEDKIWDHRVEFGHFKWLILGGNEKGFNSDPSLRQILLRSEHPPGIKVYTPTTKVVWAEIDNWVPSFPGCGSSWSVIRNTRFIAAFDALVCLNWFNTASPVKRTHPSRMTQLQLVNTSPNGACPFKGGN